MKMIDVKIALAIDGNGNWNASGWEGCDNGADMDIAIDGLKSDCLKRYTIKVSVPFPEIEQVIPEVVEESQ